MKTSEKEKTEIKITVMEYEQLQAFKRLYEGTQEILGGKAMTADNIEELEKQLLS